MNQRQHSLLMLIMKIYHQLFDFRFVLGLMVAKHLKNTPDPEIQATRNTSYLTASKSLNGRKIARMAPILTIFGPNRSQRRNLFFEKFSNERRRHRGIVVVVIVAVVVAVVGGFWVACIKGTSL